MNTHSDLSLADDADWSSRSELWKRQAGQRRPKIGRSETPLILTGHGVSIRVKAGTLAIRNGFTHHPQKLETYRYFKGDLELPDRIILLDCSGSISFDVLSWLSEQGVSIVRIDWRGEVICVSSRSGYAANPHRAQWQWETRNDPKKRMEFALGNISKKIENSILTLEKSVRQNATWNKAMEAAYSTLTKFEENPPETIPELRTLEANAAAAYFRAWRGIPIKWKGTSRKPIPESWNTIEQRTSPFKLAGSRNAGHPINAILNYAYTVLQSQIQIKAVADGYDPTVGIMHEPRSGSAAFIFDLMEPERPKIDRRVLEFVKANTFHPADFTIRSDGVCRLNPEMARIIVREMSYHF